MKILLHSCVLFISLACGSIALAESDQNDGPVLQQIQASLNAMYNAGAASPDEWDTVDKQLANYQKVYGRSSRTTHNLLVLRQLQLKVAKYIPGDEPYTSTILEIARDRNPQVAALTAKLAALKAKPISLKFMAVDGTPVDLSQMRGKVVLIDFWATWCGPCVGEVPNVVATYQKYHDQGFEVVGISLDQDKNALLSFTQQNGMTWPQYFDGNGWQNRISSSYGITGIPAMLLIGKDGLIYSYKGRENLADKVEKALAAQPETASQPASDTPLIAPDQQPPLQQAPEAYHFRQ